MKIKLMAALILGSFVLAGCGGGGGGGTTTSMPDPVGSPLSFPDLAAGRIVESGTYHVVGASAAFLAALESVVVPAGGYAPGSMITVGGLGLRCTADNTSNCSIVVNEDGSFAIRGTVSVVAAGGTFPMTQAERIEAAIAAATRRAEEAEQRAEEAEEQIAEAEREAEAAREEADRRIEEAAHQADASARASKLTPVLGGTLAENSLASMSVTHRRGESLTFRRPNNLPASGTAPSVPGSWKSKSYGGPSGAVGTETAYLYTNIQAPGSKAFWKVHGEKVTDIQPTKATVSGFGTTAKELYPANDGTPDGSSTTSGADKGRSIGGTYDGYSGTFKCDAECDIAAAEGGALTFHGTWSFAASLTAKKSSRHAEQDTEFLYFGIWAFEPTDPEGTPGFGWAAGGDATDISNTNFTALTGEATFTGGAIGKYALERATGRGARAAKTGTFTATASFTADFDTNKLSGRITDFEEGGNDLGSDWNIFLGADASTAASLTASGASGQAHGRIDGDTASGAWKATLHGSDNQTLNDRTKYPATRYPPADVAGVSGRFNARVGESDNPTAAIAGAFGAACTTGTMCAK